VVVLALAAAACYANSFGVPFLFDDPLPDVRLHYRTRPLVWASFALGRQIDAASTWDEHAFNLAIHLACALCLLGVLRRALARALPERSSGARAGLAWLVTLAWTCHPLQTASVTYLSQRAEALAALAITATLYAFLRALDSKAPRRWQVLALASLALGFGVKETVAVTPVLLFLVELALVRGALRANLRARAWLHLSAWLLAGALFLVYVGPRLFARDSSSGFGPHASFGALDYLRSQPGVILHYLRLVLWPEPLVFDYAWPVARATPQWLPQSLLLAALLVATGVALARRSALALAPAAFFVLLAPSSSLVPIKDLAFEHRMYLALAPVLALLALALERVTARVPRLAAALGVLAVLALGALTVRRNHEYRSAAVLWGTVVERAPHNARAHNNLASALIDEERFAEAETVLERALALAPESSYVHHNLARLAAGRGELARALAHLESSLALEDGAARRADMALLLRASGRAADSEPHLVRALELDPSRDGERLELARLWLGTGRAAEALGALNRLAARHPESAEVHALLDAARKAVADSPR
jgi:Tfp pilus assembly protein PilF